MGSPRLDPGLELTVYRVLQEGLTNVLRHAPSATAEVLVDHAPAGVTITISNDAVAPPREFPLAGTQTGLLGLRERVEVFGGTLTATRSPTGFVLRAHLPAPTSRG